MTCCKALIHAEQISRKQGCLVTAGPGAHFQNGVSRIIPVPRQKQQLQRVLRIGKALIDIVHLLLRHFHHLGVITSLGNQQRGGITLVLETAHQRHLIADGSQFGQFA